MKLYSKKEDRINSLTHLGGFIVLTVLVMPILIGAGRQGEWKKLLAFTVYYLCVGAMFLSSTLYHGTEGPEKRQFFRLLDHTAIPLCIAGTYTPIVVLGMEGTFPKIILLAVWILAIMCVGIQLYYGPKARPDWVGKFTLATYLLMGWMSLLMIRPILDQLSFDFIKYIVLGGIFYTLGVFFYKNKKIPYNHAIWHLFILGGTFSMFYGIVKYIA